MHLRLAPAAWMVVTEFSQGSLALRDSPPGKAASSSGAVVVPDTRNCAVRGVPNCRHAAVPTRIIGTVLSAWIRGIPWTSPNAGR
jgi:hypothetical protein